MPEIPILDEAVGVVNVVYVNITQVLKRWAGVVSFWSQLSSDSIILGFGLGRRVADLFFAGPVLTPVGMFLWSHGSS